MEENNYDTLKEHIDSMKDDEEDQCLQWLGTNDVKKALQLEFFDEVLTAKYVEVN